jgi:hypothetical protein
MFYSANFNTWYDPAFRAEYDAAGTWPNDAVEYPRELFDELVSNRPPNMQMVAGPGGVPELIPIPQPTPAELLIITRKNFAQQLLNNTQWWQVMVDLGEIPNIPNLIDNARDAAQAYIDAHP